MFEWMMGEMVLNFVLGIGRLVCALVILYFVFYQARDLERWIVWRRECRIQSRKFASLKKMKKKNN